MFPGCMIMKNDPNYIQGIPDWIIVWEDKWATFEAKRSQSASVQPNQTWYVNRMNEMSFSMFVYPENKEEFLHGIQQAFRS